ncbi:MAG: glycosyltransferase family 2 protein [Candidatus Omnitrophota bacterium]
MKNIIDDKRESGQLEGLVDEINSRSSRECERWLALDKEMSLARAMGRGINSFFRDYNKTRGEKKDLKEYVPAVMGGFYHYLSYAKYWDRKLDLEDPNTVKGSDATKAAKNSDTSDRWKLSVVILTKNEEDKIRNCLESLKWVDEIVVVDGYSTDATVDICRGYGAKVVQHRFEGNFGQERNIGIDNSSGDWVLQLDADEAVTEIFRVKMLEILREKDSRYAAYKFMRKNFFMGHFMRYGGWYHHSHHLFRRGFARYEGRVHHQLIIDGEEAFLNADIEHNPFQSFTQLLARQNRYTTLEAKEILEQRGRVNDDEVEYNIRKKPLKLFRKFYLKKQGFREGKHGFIFSVYFAWVHFLKWAKYWELCQKNGKIS